MVRLHPVGRAGILCVGLGLAFWAGRTTSAPAPDTSGDAAKRATKSAQRSEASAARSAKANSPGAGTEAITSALQLREIFKQSGGNYQKGQAVADAALGRMNSDELGHLVADLSDAQASTPGYSYRLEIATACSRWAEIDPDAALRFILSAKQASFRNAAVENVLNGIAKTDPDLALQKLASIQDPQLRSVAKNGLMGAVSISQPDLWVKLVNNDPSTARNWGVSSIVTEWAVDDPAAAAQRLSELPKNLQQGAIAALAKVWSSKDPAAAAAWVNSLPNSAERGKALGALAGGLAASDPDAAIASLSSLTGSTRSSGIGSVFQTLADQDFDAAISRAGSLSDPADQRVAFLALLGRNTAGDEYLQPLCGPACLTDGQASRRNPAESGTRTTRFATRQQFEGRFRTHPPRLSGGRAPEAAIPHASEPVLLRSDTSSGNV
ncbi:MAG: hypothetical protein QM755_19165 [Luteolibacter sp.]